jgi:hypothetical protein
MEFEAGMTFSRTVGKMIRRPRLILFVSFIDTIRITLKSYRHVTADRMKLRSLAWEGLCRSNSKPPWASRSLGSARTC